MTTWPKAPTLWFIGRTMYVSVPFTWDLPSMRQALLQKSMEWDTAVVGGPAVKLMPDYLHGIPNITVDAGDYEGVLQKVNSMATRTTVGCPKRCAFCGIGQKKIEGDFRKLDDWPNLPVICDNNILAAGVSHLEKVITRLLGKWDWADFNQGLDASLLKLEAAKQLKRIPGPMIRLALDSDSQRDAWERAFDRLMKAGIAKRRIRSYCLVGFEDSPKEAWKRCEWVESHGVKALPMWYHPLHSLHNNVVSFHSKKLGWTDTERRRIMAWFYQHRTLERGKRA